MVKPIGNLNKSGIFVIYSTNGDDYLDELLVVTNNEQEADCYVEMFDQLNLKLQEVYRTGMCDGVEIDKLGFKYEYCSWYAEYIGLELDEFFDILTDGDLRCREVGKLSKSLGDVYE